MVMIIIGKFDLKIKVNKTSSHFILNLADEDKTKGNFIVVIYCRQIKARIKKEKGRRILF